jgi:cardiolipin synthase
VRISLKTLLCGSFFLFVTLLAVQFLASLEMSPLVWEDGGLSFSRELWGHIDALLGTIRRYIYWILGIYVFVAAGVIFLEEQNPDRAIIWLGMLLLFPFVGLAAYVIFGPNIGSVPHRWRIRKTFRRRINGLGTEKTDFVNSAMTELEHLLAVSCGAVPTAHNDVDLLLNGEKTFRAIEKAIYNAVDYVHMEYFSIASDELGTKIKELLINRTKSGTKVRVLYDAVGSWHLGRDSVTEMKNAGVEIHPFMPMAFARFRSGINHRDHRKILVVDGRVGFVGGLNIGDMYMGKDPQMGNWRDTHIQITGEAVQELNHAFLDHWGECTGKYMDYRRFSYALPAEMEKTPLVIATSGPGKDFRAIADGYFHMITSARKRIWITTPYLVPGEVISTALAVAAKSGVDTRIIIPSKADHTLVFWATQFNTDQLLRSGVRIFSYQDGFIHAKTAMMDGEVVSVGTANLDERSLEINYEVQAFIRSHNVAAKFERSFLDDIEKCEEETLVKRRVRPFRQKLQAAVGRLWSSLL